MGPLPAVVGSTCTASAGATLDFADSSLQPGSLAIRDEQPPSLVGIVASSSVVPSLGLQIPASDWSVVGGRGRGWGGVHPWQLLVGQRRECCLEGQPRVGLCVCACVCASVCR